METIVKFNNDRDEFDYSWYPWMEVYFKEIFKHAKINAIEIYAAEYEEYDEITLFVKELDVASGECIEKEYSLHLFEECGMSKCLMFAHFLWEVNGCDMTLVDQAIYQIHRRAEKDCFCLLLAEEP